MMFGLLITGRILSIKYLAQIKKTCMWMSVICSSVYEHVVLQGLLQIQILDFASGSLNKLNDL